MASSKKSVSRSAASAALWRISSSYAPDLIAFEDGWIRGQAGDRELLDVALQLTRVEHLPSDVVQPQALTKVMQLRRRFHAVSYWACSTKRQTRVAR